MKNYMNALFSGLVLLGLMVGLVLVSFPWVIVLVPLSTIAILYLNIDSLPRSLARGRLHAP